MAIETIAPLILYDKDDIVSGNTAGQLQRYLSDKGMRFEVGDYSYASALAENLPQDLILVYSPRAKGKPQLENIVDNMLTQAIARRVRSIVIVTNSNPLVPQRWASIPTYSTESYIDSNNQLSNELKERVLKETQHVKLPYSQAVSLQRSQQPANRPIFRTGNVLVALVFVILGLLIVSLSMFAGLIPTPRLGQSSSLASKNTTVATTSTGNGRQGAAAQVTSQVATPAAGGQQASLNDFNSITKEKPIVSGFQGSSKWDEVVSGNTSCAYNDTSYIVSIPPSNQYQPCLAQKLLYKNFALQVTMNIKQGDAGGIIFRSSDAVYYRLSINTTTDAPVLGLFLCESNQCDKNSKSISAGLSLGSTAVQVNKQSVELTIIARDKNIDVYTDGNFVNRFLGKDPVEAGKLGVYAAAVSQKTIVTFSDLKIWSLDTRK
ncbi:MAG: hypothetical protein H0U76_01735 [Ktedonobacteraceae bacterium]|nr:hypothetical protein [Ktedonobacteraceae bacterium]